VGHLQTIWNNIGPVTEFGLTVPRDVYHRIATKADRFSAAWNVPAAAVREELLAAYVRGQVDAMGQALEAIR